MKKPEEVCLVLRDMLRIPAVKEMVSYVEGESVFLRVLIENGKNSNPSAMSELMGVTKGRITAIINRLSAKGLVAVTQDKDDRRRMHVAVTPKGEQYVVDQKKKMEENVEMLYDRLGKGKAQKMLDLIEYAVEQLA